MVNREYLFKKQQHFFAFWILIIILIIIVVLFLTCYKYNPYYRVTGIYRKEEGCVSLLLENNKFHDNEIMEIKVDNEVILKENLEVVDVVLSDSKIYYQINIYLNKILDKQFVDINIKKSQTTLWNIIWKGMVNNVK